MNYGCENTLFMVNKNIAYLQYSVIHISPLQPRPRVPGSAPAHREQHHPPAAEHRQHRQHGRQARPQEDCPARQERRVQPQAICCRDYEDQGAQDNRPHLQLRQDGLHRSQVGGGLQIGRQKVRQNRSETRFPDQVQRLQDSEHGRQLRRQVPNQTGGSRPHSLTGRLALLLVDNNLTRLVFGQFSSYEPELFPGLIYRMVKPRIVLLIFVSGKVVLTGAKVRQEIYEAFDNIYPILKNFKKQ